AASDSNDGWDARIKLSENPVKVTNPGNKTVFRIYDKESGKIHADLIALAGEEFDTSQDLMLFDPDATWKKTRLEGGSYTMKEILIPIFKNGQCVYETPSVMELQDFCKRELDTLWDESRRLVNPQTVFVDLSDKLYDIKSALLEKYSQK
nr:nicotinate phosphoribosyltransferase [Eubacterium sp.]